MSRGMRCAGTGNRLLLLACAALACAACGTLRLHDAGRLKAATEAKTIAADITAKAGGVFGPMEENLDTVRETQKTLRDLSNSHRFQTSRAIFARQSADELAGKLMEVLSERVGTINAVDQDAAAAARAVNDALDRERAIAEANKESVQNRGSLDEALGRVKSRLDWIQTVVDNLEKLEGAITKAGLAESLPSLAGAVDVKNLTDKAKTAIDQVDKDQQVAAAGKLLRQAIEEIAASEQARVLEMKRHLATIARFRDDFAARDSVSICTLFNKTVGELYPALTISEVKTGFEKLIRDLKAMKVDTRARYSCLGLYTDDPKNWPWVPPTRPAEVQQDWRAGTLASFLAADLQRRGSDATAPRLVATLAVFLFHDREYFETVRWDLAREHHRHSIRLSKVNAQERAQLVQQLTQAMEVYYQGGIKPEEVAQLVLMAGQVGALGFIGSRQ